MKWAVLSLEQFNTIIPKLPSEIIVGIPQIAIDGRRAIQHYFCEVDILFLQEKGALLCDALPNDFVLFIGDLK